MAAVIHELWEREDPGLLIMPASVPIDAPAVQAELTGWTPVIESDVDGPNSLSRQLDSEQPNLKRFSATRRVARTIYMGSTPTIGQTNKGIDDGSIKVGCVQPGESPATFGDAVRRLATRATYLVEDRGQYWYSLGQTIGRTATDRAQSRFLEEHADDEIHARLRAIREKGDFAGVHWTPRGPGDVPDDAEARLVVLGPEHPHASGTEVTAARRMVAKILDERAAGPRVNRNMLVFLAPDKARLEELREAARFYLAWRSVNEEWEELNLDAQQRRHAESQTNHFDETVRQRIGETFIWMLMPRQELGSAEVTWEQTRVTGSDPIPVRVSKNLAGEEGLLTQCAGTRLRMDLDRVLWPADAGHVSTQQLWSYYAQYLYLPRLRDRSVLGSAIEQGVSSMTWESDTFAYAEGLDEANQRFVGLRAGGHVAALIDSASVVVKPEQARKQLDEEAPIHPPTEDGEGGEVVGEELPAEAEGLARDGRPRHFYGVVVVDPVRMSRDAGQVADEVVKHLAGLVDAVVDVRIEITAKSGDGFEEEVVRTVTENARTLKFEQHGFEES
jgi:hypothetical protein